MTEQPQATDDDAMSLITALGPMAQPHPVNLQVLNLTSTEGKRWTVLILSDPTGRRAIWLEPDKAAEWANLIAQVADVGQHAPAPLTVARQMPTGMPMPGVGLRPNGRVN